MVAPRLRAPHRVSVTDRDMGAAGYIHAGAEYLEDMENVLTIIVSCVMAFD